MEYRLQVDDVVQVSCLEKIKEALKIFAVIGGSIGAHLLILFFIWMWTQNRVVSLVGQSLIVVAYALLCAQLGRCAP